jgi:hypothetical protein
MSRDNATGSVRGDGGRGNISFHSRLLCGGVRRPVDAGLPIDGAANDPRREDIGLCAVDALAVLRGVNGLNRLVLHNRDALFAEVQKRKQRVSVGLSDYGVRSGRNARRQSDQGRDSKVTHGASKDCRAHIVASLAGCAQ